MKSPSLPRPRKKGPGAKLLREAAHIETPADRLSELSRSPHKSVRETVAKNPNTPIKVLLALWRTHGKVILKDNSVLTLWEFSGASESLDDAKTYTLSLIYSDLIKEAPEQLESLISIKTRLRLLDWGERTRDIGEVFARDPSPIIRKAFLDRLLKNRFAWTTPGSVLFELARDPDVSVRLHFAEKLKLIGDWSKIPDTGILNRCALVLASHNDPAIHSRLRKCKSLPSILKKRLATKNRTPSLQ